MQLSEQAWARSSKVIEAIKNHPFNQELAKGTLSLDKFAYYIEQDILYLQEFGRCQAMIASKVPLKYVRCFLRYADDTCVVEQEVVHNFFKKMFNFQETGKLTPATLSYTSYILRNCATEPVEVAVAAVLPCFWVYSEVGLGIAKTTNEQNPFIKWIETYSSDDFVNMVKEIIGIFDALALQASDEVRLKMLDTFYKSTCLEWHFWNDAYKQTVFDGI